MEQFAQPWPWSLHFFKDATSKAVESVSVSPQFSTLLLLQCWKITYSGPGDCNRSRLLEDAHFSIGNTSSIHSILVHFPLPAILVYQSVHLSTFLRALGTAIHDPSFDKRPPPPESTIKSDVVKLGAALLPCLCKQLQQKLLSLCLQIFSSPWEEKFTLQHWMNAFFLCRGQKSRFFGEWSSHIQ